MPERIGIKTFVRDRLVREVDHALIRFIGMENHETKFVGKRKDVCHGSARQARTEVTLDARVKDERDTDMCSDRVGEERRESL
jgi:hypothetical protein